MKNYGCLGARFAVVVGFAIALGLASVASADEGTLA